MLLQGELFDAVLSEGARDTSGYPTSYAQIPVRFSTFKAGLSERVHSWFRLTPSFGPELVRMIIEQMGVRSNSHIHDPFSGAATTAIEARLEQHSASCIEVNPFLYFVGRTCLNWEVSADACAQALAEVERSYAMNRSVSRGREEQYLSGVEVPNIHNIHRWWRSDVLADLLALRAAIRSVHGEDVISFFELALASVLVPDLSNVTLGRLQLHFIDRSKDHIDVWSTFRRHVSKMISDLSLLNQNSSAPAGTIFSGDSTKEETYRPIQEIDAVITSPPYPNRYSYVWNTRPHMYMLGIIDEARQASDIDKQTIGGTWGTATSELGKGVFEPTAAVGAALEALHSRIAMSDQLMANYVVHYFNRLESHLRALTTRLTPGAKLAYVVGNSWIKGEYVETDLILARMMEQILPGATVDGLHRFRHRHSGKKLYETIVYATAGR